MDKLSIVLFGPPGAGKGTQSAYLIQQYGLVHLSTGDLLRAEIQAETELGQQAQDLMNAGELVPDHLVIGMIRNKLEANLDAKGYVFDGFPRTKAQAEALDELLAIKQAPVKVMLSLEVPEEELVKRLKGRGETSGRSDDQDVTIIRKRINEYEQKTAPLKEHYKEQGKYKRIDGMGEVNEITQRLVDAIGSANKVKA